jgi:hypothetical protein
MARGSDPAAEVLQLLRQITETLDRIEASLLILTREAF